MKDIAKEFLFIGILFILVYSIATVANKHDAIDKHDNTSYNTKLQKVFDKQIDKSLYYSNKFTEYFNECNVEIAKQYNDSLHMSNYAAHVIFNEMYGNKE